MRQMFARLGGGRAFGAIVAAAAVAAVTLGIWGLDNSLPPGFSAPASAQRPESPVPGTHHVRIGGVEYYIPTTFSAGHLEPGLDQETIYLRALHPGFAEPSAEQRLAFLAEPGWGDKITVLITSGPFPSPVIPGLWEIFWNSYGPFVEVEPIHSFERFVPANGAVHGYDLFRPIFTAQNEELILCDLPETAPNPGCRYYRIIDGAYLNIRFSRNFLSNAEQIRNDILAFLETARVATRPDTAVPDDPGATED